MGEHKGPAEVRQEIYKAMPQELAGVYLAITNELQALFFEWRWFNELYGESEETLEILNRTAKSFFGHMQHVHMGSIVLRVAKLVDSATGTKKNVPNASFQYMLRTLKEIGEVDFAEEQYRIYSGAKKAAAVMVDHRSKKYAHSNLEIATGAATLDRLQKGEFEAVLDTLATVANNVAYKYMRSTLFYAHGFEDGGPTTMVHWLAEGLAHKQCKMNELKRKLHGD